MDELTYKLLNDPSCYGRTMGLLKRYQQMEDFSWNVVEQFLMELGEDESALLEQAIKQHDLGNLNLPAPKQNTNLAITQQNSNDPLAIALAMLQKLLEAQSSGGTVISSQTSKLNPNEDLTLDELAKRFIDSKKASYKPGTVVSTKSKIGLFVKILTEHNHENVPTLSQLNPDSIRHYRDTLLKIPAYRQSFPHNATINDWIRANKPPISAKTAKDSAALIGEFLTWIEADGYPITKSLKTILNQVKKPRKEQTDCRQPFSEGQLKTLFESETYQKGLFKTGAEFWTPLLALFTGARMSELLQLHITDIRQHENIWVIDINTDDEKQVKTESSHRLIPIHSWLIKLEFLNYVNERGKNSNRLFPEEDRNAHGKFHAYSTRFNRWKEQLGVIKAENQLLDFHSFRHTVRTALTDASVQESLIDDIIGHKTQGASIGKRVYTHTQLVPQKKEAIEKLNYAIDFNKIRPWNKHKLIQILRDPTLKRAKS
ncbi:site-specific integrase [Crenothrix sp.]|uniref:site-specific integrase n=1 Tax=Crenothrix sp. TaxID=3100433 RepID=UPI00374D4687